MRIPVFSLKSLRDFPIKCEQILRFVICGKKIQDVRIKP